MNTGSFAFVMPALFSWWARHPARRTLLPQALAVVVVVRLGLSIVPIALWQRLSDRLRRRAPRATQRVRTPADISWAVRRASRAVPGASCLTQSLAAQIVLAWYGHPSRLRIGVARDGEDGLRAHAWLESNERILVGARSHEGYTPMVVPRVPGSWFLVPNCTPNPEPGAWNLEPGTGNRSDAVAAVRRNEGEQPGRPSTIHPQ